MDYASAGQAATPREAGPITMQMSQRQKLQAALDEAIGRLENRLSPLLAPEPKNKTQAGNGGPDKAQHQRHAQELAGANADLEYMIGRLNGITSRIEL